MGLDGEDGGMETEVFAVSRREMKRFELLKQVLAGKLSLAAASPALGVSYRQAKRLKAKAAQGPAALAHGSRGKPPCNRKPEGLRLKVLSLSQERYGDFNDTQFAEQLFEREGIAVSRETVRRWRRGAGIKPKCKRRAPKHHRRRPRKPAEGLMMLWDGSPHHWFGPDQPPCCLMAAIDDATGKLLSLRFVPHESSWAYLKLLEQVARDYGLPHSVYQDQHSALKRNDEHWTLEEELAGEREPTQVGSALRALEIEPVFALSPQAKGRVERLFRTLQDRLVAALRLEGISEIAAANAYVGNGFLADFNQRFAQAPQQPHSAWRKPPQPPDLERHLSLSYQATVGNDNAVRLDGLIIDVPPGPGKRGYAKARVQARQMLDGSWRVYYQDRLIASGPSTEIAELIRTRRRRTGVRAAHHPAWVNLASAPARPDPKARVTRKLPTIRRAGPGRAIKATRIA